tara:strand:+ start:160 stop:531 length:372 start_codon:yes stop_codon:yes gene_type:complete
MKTKHSYIGALGLKDKLKEIINVVEDRMEWKPRLRLSWSTGEDKIHFGCPYFRVADEEDAKDAAMILQEAGYAAYPDMYIDDDGDDSDGRVIQRHLWTVEMPGFKIIGGNFQPIIENILKTVN